MNTYIKILLSLTMIGFALTSCDSIDKDIKQSAQNKILSRIDTIPEIFPEYNDGDEIILGNQRVNPYSIDIMLDAYDLLSEYHHNFIVGDVAPYINTIYYRVLPRDSAELALLSADSSVIYFDYPLDFDIDQYGSYYHDQNSGSLEYTWLYAVVPANHVLPQIPTLEILQECYVPEENVENDDHYDYIPDWQNGFAMLEYMAYLISGNVDMYDPEVVEIYDEILNVTANRSGNDCRNQSEEGTRSAFWDFIAGVHPEGSFSVYNTYFQNNEGIKNAKVYIHNFVKSYCGPLDSNGHYYSSTRFRTHCWYHIRFENHHTLTKIYGGSKFLLGPVHRHVGWHHRYGYSCTLYHSDEAWRYATINNAVETYFNYCNTYSILFPYYMRVWVSDLFGDRWKGSTPMFHKRHVPVQSQVFLGSLLLFPDLALLASMVYFLDIPDMALFIPQADSTSKTLDVYSTVFHEFSHASHCEKVGANYWSHYVSHIIFNTGYGSEASGAHHGYCGIGEMWGNFAEAHFLYKYMGYSYPYVYINMSNNSLDYSAYIPQLVNYASEDVWFDPFEDWYNPGILAKIHQESRCSITDIYNALNPDVYALDALDASLRLQGIDGSIIENTYESYSKWYE